MNILPIIFTLILCGSIILAAIVLKRKYGGPPEEPYPFDKPSK